MEEKVYGGTFILNDKEYNGQIRYLKEKYLLLEIHLPNEIITNDDFNFENINIFGKLVTGSKVTLYKCTCIKRHSNLSNIKSIILFKCEYLIWGDHIEQEIKTLYIELENAVKWSGLSGIEQKYFDGKYFETIKYIADKKDSFLFNDFTITLSTIYKNDLGARPMPEIGSISERLSIKIDAGKNKDINQFMKLAKDICNIITFSIGNNINVLKMKCEADNSYFINSKKEKQYFLMEINGLFKSKNIYKQALNDDIVSLPEIKGEIFNKFLNNYDDIRHIIELYVLLINNPELPIHIQFLNIIQALESFHAKFICSKLDDYLKIIDNRYKESKYYEFYKNFLLPPQQNGVDYIVLTSRLNDCISRLPKEVFDDFKDFIITTKLTDTRHYYTHYNILKYNNSLKDSNLINGIRIISLVLNYLIWQHFGLNRDRYLIENFNFIDMNEIKKSE